MQLMSRRVEDDPTDLILMIYDAAVDPEMWPKVLLRIAHFVGARGATVFELDELLGASSLTRALASENYSLARNTYYFENHREAELADQEVFAQHCLENDTIDLVPCSVLAPSREELLKQDHVKTLLEIEVGYRAAALLNKDMRFLDRFAFQFSIDHGPIDQKGYQRSRLILPHLAKALNVSRPLRELTSINHTLFQGLDLLSIGICIVDQSHNILVTNQEFERQVFEYDAFQRSREGRLHFDYECAPELAKLLAASFESHGHYGARPRKEAVVYKSRFEPDHLCVDIVPIENSSELAANQRKTSILFSLDTKTHHKFDAKKVGLAFKLTDAEQTVLELVAEGYTNQEISDRLNKSKNTTDTQLKSILSKAMVVNRTQLVRIASQTRSFITENPED